MNKFYLLLFLWLSFAGCFNNDSEQVAAKKSEEEKIREANLKQAKELFGETPYLRGDEPIVLLQELENLEANLEEPIGFLRERYGKAIDSVMVTGVLEGKDMQQFYFDISVSEFTKIYLNATIVDDMIIGYQLSSQPNKDLLYSSARFYISSRDGVWQSMDSIRGFRYSFQQDSIVWQIDFRNGYIDRHAVVNMGTVSYSNLNEIWDASEFWGKDGYGLATGD